MKILIAIIAISLSSCSTTNKHKVITKTSTDSVSVVKETAIKNTDSTGVKKANIVVIKEGEGSYEKETVYEFSTNLLGHGLTKHYIDSMNAIGQPLKTGEIYPVDPSDYFPVKITIKEKGQNKSKETKTDLSTDSAVEKTTEVVTKDNKTDLHKTEFTKDKTVKRTGVSVGVWIWGGIAIAIGLLGWYFGWWTWLFALLKRRKK